MDEDEGDEQVPDGDPAAALMLAEAKALMERKNKIKKRPYGLERLDGRDSDDDSGSSDGGAGLKGAREILEVARLDRSMSANSAAFCKVLRDRAPRHFLGADSSGSTDLDCSSATAA